LSPSWPRPTPPPLSLAREALLLRACPRLARSGVYLWASWPSIVTGAGSRPGLDFSCEAARARGVPVYVRRSGGGAVVHGPGVLAVTLVSPTRGRAYPGEVYARGTRLLVEALRLLGFEAGVRNEGDIVVGGWKVGGSAAVITWNAYLYHAVLTVDEPLEGVHELTPPRLDLVEARRLDPVKYRPAPLAIAAGPVRRRAVVEALAGAAAALRLPEPTSIHYSGDPCVAATAAEAPGLARGIAARDPCRLNPPSSQRGRRGR